MGEDMQRKNLTVSLFVGLALAQLLASNIAFADETQAANPATSISHLYSDVELNLNLAVKPNAIQCLTDDCAAENATFDARVQNMGQNLSEAAFAKYPNLKNHVKSFSFNVADKQDIATTSNAAGKIVVLRGLQQLELSDDALNFLLAREMAHVIAKHHNKNITAKLIISALASVAFPAIAIASASSAAAHASTATTLITSAASTATSMVGSEVAIRKMKPAQLLEADEIALNLMDSAPYIADWQMAEVANTLQFDVENLASNQQTAWVKDLAKTALYLENKASQLAEVAANAMFEEQHAIAGLE